MYKINKQQNNIIKLEERLFSELKIRERENLQEWIAKNPDALGEDLLIIQKEFDGFNDTNERLDLLALDKDGGLVVIENKLDDSGRNVVWQALKYTSYCSTLTTAQIIRMFQNYLDGIGSEENAKETILEFVEWEDEELLLNTNDQRIIFVANHYRKEVTSTVLWLLNHEVQIQCFRATPFSMGDDLFLQIEQIIPLPETKEFMIDAKEKERESKGVSKAVAETQKRLFDFWSLLKRDLVENQFDILERTKANNRFSIGAWKGTGKYSFCLGRKTIRVELYISRGPVKKLYDMMESYKDEIEEAFGKALVWQRLDNKKASRIKFEFPEAKFKETFGDWSDHESWQKRIDWYRESMQDFYNTINPYWEKTLNQFN